MTSILGYKVIINNGNYIFLGKENIELYNPSFSNKLFNDDIINYK